MPKAQASGSLKDETSTKQPGPTKENKKRQLVRQVVPRVGLPFPKGYTFYKSFFLFPGSQHFLLDGGEVEACKFSIFSVHNLTTLAGWGKLGALPFIKWAKVLQRAVAWEGDFGRVFGGGICRFCLIFKRKKTIGRRYLVN